MDEKKNKYDLDQRLIDFAILIIRIAETMNKSYPAQYVKGQMVRSGISPGLHYGEVRAAESADDFIHKVKVILKELRETFNGLKIIKQAPLSNNLNLIDTGIKECNELISIFVTSIDTAQKNKLKRK